MSTFNSHDARPRTKPHGEQGKAEPGAMSPDPAPTLLPAPQKPKVSQTDLDKERADGEGMIPKKPKAAPSP